ncbi:MAG: hypothetical protein Ct9H300mP21_10880 [Pseudomonadota bacterium]|nr:MAG: hypothetical protein Ct9H300mP21_10880 [Pseudomonadota bacterium]
MLSSKIAKKYGAAGLPDNTIPANLWVLQDKVLEHSWLMVLLLSLRVMPMIIRERFEGGRVVVYPPKKSTFSSSENILIGNTVLYGALAEKFISAVLQGTLCCPNSGVMAGVEGVGTMVVSNDGGRVIVLGETGKNFAQE